MSLSLWPSNSHQQPSLHLWLRLPQLRRCGSVQSQNPSLSLLLWRIWRILQVLRRFPLLPSAMNPVPGLLWLNREPELWPLPSHQQSPITVRLLPELGIARRALRSRRGSHTEGREPAARADLLLLLQRRELRVHLLLVLRGSARKKRVPEIVY